MTDNSPVNTPTQTKKKIRLHLTLREYLNSLDQSELHSLPDLRNITPSKGPKPLNSIHVNQENHDCNNKYPDNSKEPAHKKTHFSWLMLQFKNYFALPKDSYKRSGVYSLMVLN